MEENKNVFSDMGSGIIDYAESWYKLTLLTGTKKATRVAAFLGLFVLFFAGLALGIWLGNLLNNESLGYIIVSGAFLLIMVILIALRNKIVFPLIRDGIIRNIYENNQ
jgi:hypothetical protein